MKAGYFQFPLSLLGYGGDKEETLNAILSYNIVEYARRTGKSITRKTLKGAQKALGVECADPLAHEERWRRAAAFVQRRERAYGKDAFVRIGCQLVWDCLNGSLSYRDFSLICAINSVLGRSKKPRRITEPDVRVRAAGYKSWKDFQADVPAEQRKAKLLTEDKVRYSLERLHKRKFFARIRVSARVVKYFNFVSDDELKRMLTQTETSLARFRRERRERDAATRAAIKAINGAPSINVGTPINVGTSINVGKNDSQKPPDKSRHDTDGVPDGVPDINVCVLNEGVLNEGVLNESKFNESKSNEDRPGLTSGLSNNKGEEKKEEKEEDGFEIEGQYFSVAEATKFVTDNPGAAEAITTTARRAKKRGDRWFCL